MGSFSQHQLMNSGNYTANFKAVGAHGSFGRVWAYNQSGVPVKKTVAIDNNAPNCGSIGDI